MNQNLSLYRIFYATALAGNISKAADELFISQPAISQSIKKLEQSLDTALFVRSSRGVQLTEEGELLFSHVKSAFQTLEAGEHQLRLRRELGMGHLRIGVSSTLCKYVLLPYLTDFVKLHPHIQVTIACQSTNHTLQMLEHEELDLGLTGRPEHLHGMKFYPVRQIQDIFVASREYLDHLLLFLEQNKQESPSDVSGLLASNSALLLKSGILMMLDKDNLTRQYLDQYFKEQQLFPENILEATSMDLLIDFAKIGLGIACVIREFVEEDLKAGTLLELPVPFPIASREIGFVFSWKQANQELIEELINPK
ncbi:MAG: LysR family transcriptional regulator [Lachnospiraceae bacterium]|jgi:DNA-binding transcriptional LysR family regulator|nr:LysR family transcriptional regulator [Lachnospiraceae bacterium]